ncbi:MAG TPA: glucose-6-phosphate dehydrogenase assembly protein OpcA, partial [Mycobacteriales bacterium]|nr:glucose-6-phosphate dehydrogenase assembly protein OpcA [Mycobacteriales bacterium]
LALTLVVVVGENDVTAAERAATRAAAEHPCRLLIVVRRDLEAATPRLDAEVLVGGRLGPGEAAVLLMSGRLGLHAESVVLPLLAPDAPVVTWWFDAPPPLLARDPLGVLADRRITDVSLAADPVAALAERAADYAPGDTDLSWTRATPWRALCASALDVADVEAVDSACVTGQENDPSQRLLAGWLGGRLGLDVGLEPGADPIVGVAFGLKGGQSLRLTRHGETSVLLQASERTDRTLPLVERGLGDLLAEELRRLDADEPYAEALEVATGERDLSDRSPTRTHVWHDPEQPGAGPA